MQLKDGSILQNGKYRIIRVLGQGGFGITYLAEHTMLDTKVAIKEFFPKQYCDRDEATSHVTVGTQSNQELIAKLKHRFLKEAKNISKLRHPGIISIHDIFEENNSAYYVMDFIEGESLSEIVKREGAMDEARAVGYIRKVGEALEYIHSRNMTHFDVKPANIMVRKEDDYPILIDFGLSKQYNDSGEATTTGLMGVSRGFSAIELTNLSDLVTFSEQSDVYSIGATLLYLLTGNIPPDASALVSGSEELSIPSFVSVATAKAIESAMEVNRNKRTMDIKAFLSGVKGFYTSSNKDDIESSENTLVLSENVNDKILTRETVVYTTIAAYDDCITLDKCGDILSEKVSIQWYLIDKNTEGYSLSCDFTPLKSELEHCNLSELRSMALAGDSKSQVLWGWICEHGYGVLQSDEESVKWYEKASVSNNNEGYYHLGRMYHLGKGVEKNLIKAFRYYFIAAQRGNANAMASVAWLFYNGLGTEINRSKAIKWYENAASAGHTHAMILLSEIYSLGKDVKKDLKRALQWHLNAAEGNAVTSMTKVAEYYASDNIDHDELKSIYWYEKAANLGEPHALIWLGDKYRTGDGIEQDIEKAIYNYQRAADQGYDHAENILGELYYTLHDYEKAAEWFMKGVNHGNLEAHNNLAILYKKGLGVERDCTKALELLEKAIINDNPKALFNLGAIYHNGEGTDIDYDKAVKYYTKAADRGYVFAQYNLGLLYELGHGVHQSFAEAFDLYKNAALQGLDKAQYKLAKSYQKGMGVEINIEMAYQWYKKAADQNHAKAQYELGNMYFLGNGLMENWDEALKWWEKSSENGFKAAHNIVDKYKKCFKGSDHPNGWLDRIKVHMIFKEYWIIYAIFLLTIIIALMVIVKICHKFEYF